MEEQSKQRDGLVEGDALFGDEQIDRVEMFVAAEARGEVSVMVDGGVELMAERAEESEVSLGGFGGDVEDTGDDELDGDFVFDFEENVWTKASGHGCLLG